MFVIWKIDSEKEYKLRLTTAMAMQAEKQLGMGLPDALNHIMDTTVIVVLLWAGLQAYNHELNLQRVCELYDEYLANGGKPEKLVMDVLMKLFAQVGLIDDTKNAESQETEE